MNSRRLVLGLLGLALTAAAGAVFAPNIAMTGGPYVVTITSFNSGGGTAAGGVYTHTYTIGAPSTNMSGGGYTLSPGPVNAVREARMNLDDAHAYPNPYRPSQGHNRVIFTALMPDVTINLYTVAGQRVRSLSKNDNTDSLTWVPANERGEPLASGVYFYVITQKGFTPKRGKLMIIK